MIKYRSKFNDLILFNDYICYKIFATYCLCYSINIIYMRFFSSSSLNLSAFFPHKIMLIKVHKVLFQRKDCCIDTNSLKRMLKRRLNNCCAATLSSRWCLLYKDRRKINVPVTGHVPVSGQ